MARKERSIEVVSAVYSGNTTTLSLPTTNTIYTNSIDVSNAERLNMSAVLNGVLDSANCIITAEHSFEQPLIEGSAHPSYMPGQTLGITAVGTWNHTAVLYPYSGSISTNYVALPFIRFMVTSATTNTSSTVNIKVLKVLEG